MNTQFERSTNTTTTWLTPPSLLKKLGEFDLDPCTPEFMPWETAKHRYTPKEDGLKQEWFGRVFLNPPYGKEMAPFLKKMKEHGNGIALLFNRSETNHFFFDYVWDGADAILFMKGRIYFCTADGHPVGRPGCGSVLVAYGKNNIDCLKNVEGKLLMIKQHSAQQRLFV